MGHTPSVCVCKTHWETNVLDALVQTNLYLLVAEGRTLTISPNLQFKYAATLCYGVWPLLSAVRSHMVNCFGCHLPLNMRTNVYLELVLLFQDEARALAFNTSHMVTRFRTRRMQTQPQS